MDLTGDSDGELDADGIPKPAQHEAVAVDLTSDSDDDEDPQHTQASREDPQNGSGEL